MWKTVHLAILVGALALSPWQGMLRADDSSPADNVRDVQAALAAMQAWLGDSARGPAWQKLLKSEQLSAELAKGTTADKVAVKEILAAYASAKPGLEHPRFAAVRKALESWLAELSIPTAEELPAAARAAAGGFTPLDAQRVAKSKARLAAAVITLDQWLAKGDAKTSAGWKAYLAWDDLQKLLAADGSPDAKANDALIAKYRGNETGLELARFLAVRDALLEYARAVEHSSEEKVKAEYPKQLEDLALRLENFAKTASGEDAATAGRLVAWLEQTGQAPALVSGVRRNFSGSNLYVSISGRLINGAVYEKVDNVARIQDVILKTQIEGTAYTRGQIGAELVPSADCAALDIILSGSTYSDNVGWQGPVTIYSVGNTAIHGRKRLFIDAVGLRAAPAVASCTTSSSINEISAPLRLIERMAWRKAGKSQGQAEVIASGKAEVRVAAQMDDRVAELVTKSNATFRDKFRYPLVRRGEFPQLIKFKSTDGELTLEARQRNAAQLAAAGAPPAIGQEDLTLRVHESLVSNFAEGAIGGETLTDKKLADLLLDATGSVPEELKISPDKDPWSITFHAVQPVSVVFADNTIKIAIRGQKFVRGDTAIKETMVIAATYKIERSGVGAKLTRQGEVTVDYIKPGRLTVAQVALKKVIQRKFDALFKPEIDRGANGLQLPGRLEQVGPLELAVMSADKGWLAAAWKLPSKARTANVKTR